MQNLYFTYANYLAKNGIVCFSWIGVKNTPSLNFEKNSFAKVKASEDRKNIKTQL